MSDVEIKFEREGVSGIVAVGTYVLDAAKRFGVRFENACKLDEKLHFCAVGISEGSGLLSAQTSAEEEYFSVNDHSKNERLGCQVKIEKPGEVVVMTKEKKPAYDKETQEAKDEAYRKEFAELPLEKKISELVQLEAIALSDTLSFVINSPYKIADKFLDVLAEFGFKKEKNEKDAVRPEEHRTNGSAEKGSETKAKKKKSDVAKPETDDAVDAIDAE
jgi:ferredoxin